MAAPLGDTLVRAMLDAHPRWPCRPSRTSRSPPACAPCGPRNRRDPGRAVGDEAPDLHGLAGRRRARAVAAYAAERGKPRYADKTPHDVSYLPALAARFAEAQLRPRRARRPRRGAVAARGPVGAGHARGRGPAWRRRVLEGRDAGLPPDGTASCATRRSSPTPSASCARSRPGSSSSTTARDARLPGPAADRAHPEHHRRLALAPTRRAARLADGPADAARYAAGAGDALRELGY